MGLTFTHNGHRYRLDGEPVPSVTTIINGGAPKPALKYWAAKVVAEAVADMPSTVDETRRLGRDALVAALSKLPDQFRSAAALKGTDVHQYAEHVISGEPAEVPIEIADHVDGYARWLERAAFEPTLVERPVASRRHGYAGRFDLIGVIDDETWLLDIKTGSGIYGETACQLAAYARADFYSDGTPNGDELGLPHIDRIGVLHVREDGTDLYAMGPIDPAFAEFLAMQVIHSSTKRRNALVGEPVKFSTLGALF